MEFGALFAKRFEYVQNGFLFQSGQSACGSDANAFAQQADRLTNPAGFDSQAVKRLRLGKGFAASSATKTADFTVSVSEFGEVFGFTGAAYTVQLAFLGKVGYCYVASENLCDLTRSQLCAWLRSVAFTRYGALFSVLG
jgi:hypothetical protein